ncbi:hypothetical protein WHR41_04564 [Cladosporium halotolerans]|uniref:Uncharacterized protein n=1 Tax=Cladosporium halotolerans TaxID=1052096 RepID=A0AB34KTF8_9PEZI
MAATTVQASVVIEKGIPLDYQKYRHTSLYFEFANLEPSATIQVIGPKKQYIFECKDDHDPTQNRSLAKIVALGSLAVETNRARLIQILQTVPIRNRDWDFDCQQWVEAALSRLKELGMLTSEAYTKGLDGMVDAISEAQDEE